MCSRLCRLVGPPKRFDLTKSFYLNVLKTLPGRWSKFYLWFWSNVIQRLLKSPKRLKPFDLDVFIGYVENKSRFVPKKSNEGCSCWHIFNTLSPEKTSKIHEFEGCLGHWKNLQGLIIQSWSTLSLWNQASFLNKHWI